jgi:hypothetical protein
VSTVDQVSATDTTGDGLPDAIAIVDQLGSTTTATRA